MSDVAIRVENLGKRYQLRRSNGRSHYRTLREELLQAPGRILSSLKSSSLQKEEFWALRGVSFEVKQGEVLGVIGRNGAGKSTLLKILSRIVEPSEGVVDLYGRVGSLLEVGTGFHPELTGRENIFLSGAMLGMRRAEVRARLDEIVEFAEMGKFLETPCKHYSSGMYARLGFAVAAHLAADILVIDEVLAVGDATFQRKCLSKMSGLAKNGRTVLFVSHNMSAVRNLCSKGLLLEDGTIQFTQALEQAISRYQGQTVLETVQQWSRPASVPLGSLGIRTIQVDVQGQQPRLCLICEVILECVSRGPETFIAVDICGPMRTPLMQALPRPHPFIPGNIGTYRVLIEVELPPLIPGCYTADFWLGSHFLATVDQVTEGISFEITDSPNAERIFPYTSDHGFLAPMAKCSCEIIEAETQ